MGAWRLTMTAWPLLLGLAMASAAHAEQGDEREFSAYGDSEAEACEEARQEMQDENHAARGDGGCYRCEAQHLWSYPYGLSGEWFCAIWGVEQASDEMILVLPSSDDDTDVDDDEDAGEYADEDAGAEEEDEDA